MAQQRTRTKDQDVELPETPVDGSSPDDQSLTEGAMALRATAGDIQTKQVQNMQTFLDWLVAKAQTTDEDQYAVMASIISEIMEATSVEEAMAEKSALHARDIIGIPLLVHSFEIRAGEYEDSQTGHYAALHCSRQGSDQTRVITCGAMKVLAKLCKLEQLDAFPVAFWFTEKQSSKGYGVIDMVTPSL